MDDIFDKYDLAGVDESFPIPKCPASGLILLVGSSGSGKSTILTQWFGATNPPKFDDRPIYKNFSSPQVAEDLLISCGLRTVPAWQRSHAHLSGGEQHRAECALSLDMGQDWIDEFTSVVDRSTAHSLSFAMQKHYRRTGSERLVIASCHRDIIPWLNPDAVYDTDLKQWADSTPTRGLVHRPKISVQIKSVEGPPFWERFKRHHYLSGDLNKSSSAFAAFIDGQPVGFCAILAFPNGNFKNGWREHRTVILPEFQGLGIGSALSEAVAQEVLKEGGRFFSKTSHPAFGVHRNKSEAWRGTSKNGRRRSDYKPNSGTKEDSHKMLHAHRVCYSHEYIGGAAYQETQA